MRFACMAHGALRNSLRALRWMLCVAIQTANSSTVLATMKGYLDRFLGMAHNAVIIGYLYLRGDTLRHCNRAAQNQNHGDSKNFRDSEPHFQQT
jgi:hypothetical protein